MKGMPKGEYNGMSKKVVINNDNTVKGKNANGNA
jgi:hypothetical protein